MKNIKGKFLFSVSGGKKGKKVTTIEELEKLIKNEYKEEGVRLTNYRIQKGLTEAEKAKKRIMNKELNKQRRNVRVKMTVGKYPHGKVTSSTESGGIQFNKRSKNLILDTDITSKPQQYLVIAKLFYLIVCMTPIDEPYLYVLNTPDGPKIRHHTIDDEVLRNLWGIKINVRDKGSFSFSKSDFNVDWNNERGNSYKTIANSMRKKCDDGDIVSFNIWNSYQPHDGFNKIMALEYGKYEYNDTADRHVGEDIGREHGLVGGYSIQAPTGFVRLAWQMVENEAEHIMQERMEYDANPKGRKPMMNAANIKTDIEFNLDISSERYDTVKDAVSRLQIYDKKKVEEITRNDIARAIGEQRHIVPVTIAELKEYSRKKEEEKELARIRKEKEEAERKIEKGYELHREANKRYYEKKREDILKNRKASRVLQGSVTAGGSTVVESLINLGGNRIIAGHYNLSKAQFENLINAGEEGIGTAKIEYVDYNPRKRANVIRSSKVYLRYNNGVIEIDPRLEDEWIPIGEFIESVASTGMLAAYNKTQNLNPYGTQDQNNAFKAKETMELINYILSKIEWD